MGQEGSIAIGLVDAIPIATVTFLAALVQGVLGFGFTLLAISFFLIFVGSAAIPLLVMLNLAITLVLAPPLWRHVPGRLWLTIVAGAMFGFPLGIVAFGAADIDHLKIAAGVVVVTLACLVWLDVSIVPNTVRRGSNHRTAWSAGTGVISGFMATALGMPGPILVLYLSGLGLEKNVIRAIAITFLALSYSVAMLLHATLYTIEAEVWITAVLLLPVAAIGSWSGHLLAPRVGYQAFRQAVLVLITGSGIYTIISALN